MPRKTDPPNDCQCDALSPLGSNTKLRRSFILTLWNAGGSVANRGEKTWAWNVFSYLWFEFFFV